MDKETYILPGAWLTWSLKKRMLQVKSKEPKLVS